MLGLEPPQGHQEGVCRIRLHHLHVYQGSRGADEDDSPALPRPALVVWIYKVDWNRSTTIELMSSAGPILWLGIAAISCSLHPKAKYLQVKQ
jgi:hypothetical protein